MRRHAPCRQGDRENAFEENMANRPCYQLLKNASMALSAFKPACDRPFPPALCGMSIITKRGDDGHTDLMYGKRIAKTDLRVAAYGTVDELTALLGIVRACCRDNNQWLAGEMAAIQDELIALMGELATHPEDAQRYIADGHKRLEAGSAVRLEELASAIEAEVGQAFRGWSIPGAEGPLAAAHLDHARTVARRAEREILDLVECEPALNEALSIYLNRLSDVLWLLARKVSAGQAE